jgi:hypothetical protein
VKIAAVVQLVVEVPDEASTALGVQRRLAELGLACRVVAAWRVDVRFVRLRGIKRGCTATISEVRAEDDTVLYRYDDTEATYRVPRDWFVRSFTESKATR